jgi:predicted transcriptional regulator
LAEKKVVGAYLSDTLAAAIETLAEQEGRSKSHILRDLVRSELKRRGLLPMPPSPAVQTTA